MLQEDVWLMKDVGFDAYHLSISWPRIFPEGVGAINKEGVEYYHNLLDALLKNGKLRFEISCLKL